MAIYIKFDGVDGESVEANHKGWCEAESFSYGMSAPVDIGGTGLSAGRVSMHPSTFQLQSGRHTPPLDAAIQTGKHFATVEIHYTVQTSNSTPEVNFKMVMKDVLIGDYSSSKHGESKANEGFTVYAAEISREYLAQNTEGGALTTVGETSYNTKTATVS